MPQMQLLDVSEDPREWTGKYGTNHSFKIWFGDGSEAEITCKPENSSKVLTMLKEQKGKSSDTWEVADGGTFPSGDKKPLRVTNYPGKPSGDFRGGSSGGGSGRRGPSPDERVEMSIGGASHDAATVIASLVRTGYFGEKPNPDELLLTIEAITHGIVEANRRIKTKLSPPTPAGSDAGPGPAPAALPSDATATTDGDSPADKAAAARSTAIAAYGSIVALKDAYEQYFGTDKPVQQMTPEELDALLLYRQESLDGTT